MRSSGVFSGTLALAVAAALTAAEPGPGRRPGPEPSVVTAKVDPRVLSATSGIEQDLLVVLSEQADLSEARSLPTKLERRRAVLERLTETARRGQASLRADLVARGIEHKTFWIANLIHLRGRGDLIRTLAARADVARIEPNLPVTLHRPRSEGPEGHLLAAAAGPEWNLEKVGAPEVWAAGYTGQGVVVGGADSGYDWAHPALKAKYRGWNGTVANHAYNWHDAIHDAASGNPCGSDSPVPCDDGTHGTHTMGIVVGDDGAGNQIGMAPGAKWIGCRNMDRGVGTPARYIECFQWFLAPTDAQGANPDPARAPEVINNSWDCPPSEGCSDPDVLKSVVQNLRDAGIVVVVSAGNQGPLCGSVGIPQAYHGALTVGATGPADAVAGYSSRGPGQNGSVKPDVAAPGSGVRSSVAGGGFATQSGTSMAAPHAAGLAALVLSASPLLDADSVQELMQETAVPIGTAETCGARPAGAVPNNAAGYGRIDALAAVNAALGVSLPTVPMIGTLSPGSGPAGGDTPLTIAGTNFVTGATVTIGGVPAADVVITDPTTISAKSPVLSPGTLNGVVVKNPDGRAGAKNDAWFSDFLDVPATHGFHDFIVRLARRGVTAGCGSGNYCPNDPMTRAQMAVFLLRAKHGPSYVPPGATGTVFQDVAAGSFAAAFIEAMAAEGITGGCGGGNFCPTGLVTRAQMAVFLLRAEHGPLYAPPPASGTVFGDVPANGFAASYIEAFAAEGITAGCGSGNYCPSDPATRGQMAVLLVTTFQLP